MQKYAKAFVALAGLLAAVGKAFSDGSVSSAELGAIVPAALAVVGVWAVPNKQTP